MHPRFVASVCAAFLSAASVHAGIFTTVQGQPFEAEVEDLYGDSVLFSLKEGTRTVDLNSLDDASLQKVAEFLAARPAAPRWNQSTSKVAKSISRKLQVLKNGKLTAFDPGDRPEPKFYVLYYGAYWCGPCRRFSPRLVEAYHQLKALAPDSFEVIFVSSDNNAHEQLAYANEVKMPWPILNLTDSHRIRVFEQWRADGIPAVVVVTREGDALLHSYRGKEYLGPDDPLTKFTQLLELTTGPAVNVPRIGRHRLAIAQHLLATHGNTSTPKPYLVGLDHRKLRTLPKAEIKVQVTVSPKGQVDDIEFLTQLDAVHKDQLRVGIEQWLFLPALEGGHPRQSTVVVPLDFSKS